jgi:Glycogen recognition site of AMP-activated protein kinase
MPVGKHQFKFIVDDEWKCSEDLPVGNDPEGNLVNCLEVVDVEGGMVVDGLEDLSKDLSLDDGKLPCNPALNPIDKF